MEDTGSPTAAAAAGWSGVSPIASLSLDDLIARLSRRPVVEGLLTIGTTAGDRLTPHSDYDLVVVLAERPVPVQVGLGSIGGRLADLLFVDRSIVRKILDHDGPFAPDAWIGRTVRWLGAGEIHFDRHGLLRRAQDKVRSHELLRPVGDRDVYAVWFGINYNRKQTERMLAAADPTYLEAVDLHLTYMIMQAVAGYFTVRGLLWEGEKAAVRYLREHDPVFHACLSALFAAGDRTERFRLYKELAERTLEPVPAVWSNAETAFTFDTADEPGGVSPIREAVEWWDDLIGKD
jgi:hypothetical protein